MSHRTPQPHKTQFEPLQVTVREAGRLLSYDTRTISRLVARGELEVVGQGRLRRVPLSSLLAYQQRHLGSGQRPATAE